MSTLSLFLISAFYITNIVYNKTVWYNYLNQIGDFMHQKRVIIVGGGASGMMAALSARKQGAEVTILERNHKLGKKILATGNGRCNFTNVDANPHDYNHPDFVNQVFEQFSVSKTIHFFKQMGIYPKIEDEGKTYPLSEQASSINFFV